MANPSGEFDLNDLIGRLKERRDSAPRRPGGGGGVPRWLVTIPIVLLALWFLGQCFVLVGAGERAVVFNRFSGVEPRQLGEGMNFLIPWVQKAEKYDVKTHAYTMTAGNTEGTDEAGSANDALTALTSDGLPVSLDMSILFHVDPESVWRLHREIGPNYLEKIVRPQTRSHVRMVVAQYPVVDVYGGRRTEIMEKINDRLRPLFARNYIVLDEALLRNVRFSEQFQEAIEQKQVAQQEVQRMRHVLDQADKERRRKIIQAEGEAASIRLKAAALARNPQLVEYEYVQRLPDNVRTIITDGRTIVNLGEAPAPAAAATETEGQQPAQGQ
jgi:prohibitin 2